MSALNFSLLIVHLLAVLGNDRLGSENIVSASSVSVKFARQFLLCQLLWYGGLQEDTHLLQTCMGTSARLRLTGENISPDCYLSDNSIQNREQVCREMDTGLLLPLHLKVLYRSACPHLRHSAPEKPSFYVKNGPSIPAIKELYHLQTPADAGRKSLIQAAPVLRPRPNKFEILGEGFVLGVQHSE
ncbi:uncharacterized protein PHACADRAFT_181884 [Phanerochaete carnosa HHB-10118-sp]|uniref:Uncharacterized protein n=1 Tax=Phanerochaete carnosa (strain HHB-10118-sp) TaxID=650164 RepID=K5WLB5_PHACS|nr:uncharacterized protein PHACADRAFT_181884 [Phanerochaete carnosa HHB-10118-sp]EKM59969.1 hypothetical protein PHACADRAFT_181884 [Phanerochaete carnosa HHB-10118-sp]